MTLQGNAEPSVVEKERRCIELASRIMMRDVDDRTLTRRFKDMLAEPFEDIIGMIFLPIFILFSPYSIYHVLKSHRESKNYKLKLQNRYKNYDDLIRNFSDLWSRYGLDLNQYGVQEVVLAKCLSDWLRILYGNRYYYSYDEIIELFNQEERAQGRVMSEMYQDGLMVNLVHWRIVVAERIIEGAPRY